MSAAFFDICVHVEQGTEYRKNGGTMNLLISGYGEKESPSLAEYRVENGQPRRVWEKELPAPSFFCRPCESRGRGEHDFLFTLSEREDGGELLLLERMGDACELLDRMPVEGTLLCQLEYSPRWKMLYAACYGSGHLIAVRVGGRRFAGVAAEFVTGEPDHLSRTHCCTLSPDEEWLYAVNIAQDRIDCFHADSLLPNAAFPCFHLPEGEGPRHLKFLPGSNIAYLITEYSNRIHVFCCEPRTGELRLLQSVGSLPSGFSGESYSATVAFSPNGDRLYAANRGADTVAVFPVLLDGILGEGREYSCRSGISEKQAWPRDIAVSADGGILLCANQRADEVVLFALDREGGLAGPAAVLPFPAPSCVLELR